jgi:hypothetical protein
MRRMPRICLAGIVLTASFLAGCAGAVGNENNKGPFGNGGDPGELCTVATPGGVASYGTEEFSNSGPATAVIQKVSLSDPHNLRMLAAYVVPITGNDLYGIWRGFPSAIAEHQPGVQWSERQWADGARVSHSRGHVVTNLVIVLKPVGKTGTAKGIEVHYRESSQQYVLRTSEGIEIVTSLRCPS